MKTVKQLRDLRAQGLDELEQIKQGAIAEKRGLTEDEKKQVDIILDKDTELEKDIGRAQRMEDAAARKAEQTLEDQLRDPKKDKGEAREYAEIYKAWIRGGHKAVNQKELEILEKRGTDDQTVGTDEHGGYIVPTLMHDRYEVAVKKAGGVEQVANILNTESGADLTYPILDDTSTSAVLVTEMSSAAIQDILFENVTLNSYNYGTGRVMVSRQLLRDAAFPADEWVMDAFAMRFVRGQNAHFTTGTGSNQPQGCVTASGLGKTAAAVAAITAAELMDLQHSVDPAYRFNGSWMMHDSTLKAIKQLSIGSSDDRPLWLPSLRDSEPDTILGDRYTINNDMAELATGNKTVLYGDFSRYTIRRVQGMFAQRLEERYAEQYAVCFLGWQSADGKYTGATSDKAIKHLIQA